MSTPLLPADHRPPSALSGDEPVLIVMDVDSTLIQDEVIELVAEHAGTRAEVAAVTEAAMRGELDFAESLHARVATLAGLPEEVLAQVRRQVRLTPGARTVAQAVRATGSTLALVSGGFVEIVGPLAAHLGIEDVRANSFEIVDGRLTGRVLGEVVDRAGKARYLREVAQARGIPQARTVAVGDGANDLDMMAAAALGVAFCAKPAVRAQADVAVLERDLAHVLTALGWSPERAADDEGGRPLA